MSLSGKVAVVTGGSSGIGEATAKLFAKEGAKVCIAARREEKLENICSEIVATGGSAMYVKVDITVLEDVKKLFSGCIAKFGKVDILFNNAGYEGVAFCPEPAGFPSIPDEMIAEVSNVNMIGPLYCAKYAIIEMQKNGDDGGVIISNSSVGSCAPLMLSQFLPVYSPTKSFMDSLGRSIAATHASSNIYSYNVNPLAIMTEMWDKIYDTVPEYVKESGLVPSSKDEFAIGVHTQHVHVHAACMRWVCVCACVLCMCIICTRMWHLWVCERANERVVQTCAHICTCGQANK